MGVHETIVNLEMSGFLYASMINLSRMHSNIHSLCGNLVQTNGNPQYNYNLQRPPPLRSKVYIVNKITNE